MRQGLLFLLIFCIQMDKLLAQDTIYMKRSGKAIPVKVIEIGEGNITYQLSSTGGNSDTTKIRKVNLRKIKLKNGEVITYYADKIFDLNSYNKQKRLLFKIEPLAWRRKTTLIWAEYSLTPRISLEAGYGLIGEGIKGVERYDENLNGREWSLGLKFYTLHSYYRSRTNPRLMRGFYWKPELNTINYTTVANNFWLVDTNDVVAASGTYTNIYRAKGWNFCNTIGYQHVFPFGLSLEFQISMGLGKRTFTVVRENSNVIPDIPLPNGGMEMVMSVPTNEWFNNYGFPLNQVDKLGFTSYFRFKVGYALWPRNIRKGK